MCTGHSPLWWDRDCDSSGTPIRADVRSAAHGIWDYARQETRTILGDVSDTPGLMEDSVLQVSHYLDRRAVPLFEKDPSALLVCAFYRRLRRHVAKLRRLELTSNISSLPAPPLGRSCPSKEDCRLDAEKVLHKLSQRARQMFRLRDAGYDWEKVAEIFDTSEDAARVEFSRELKRLKNRLGNKPAPKSGSTPCEGDS